MEPKQLTKEDLDKMSPEEIAQLQKENCIFCHIVNGKVASKKVFEDDICLAILDINPANPGHILLLPKEHYAIMPQIPINIIQHIFRVSRMLSLTLLRSIEADGTNIFVANGVSAGQKAQHFMMHIIPRKDDDGLAVFELNYDTSLRKNQAELASKIMGSFQNIAGNKIEVQTVSQDLEPFESEQPKPIGAEILANSNIEPDEKTENTEHLEPMVSNLGKAETEVDEVLVENDSVKDSVKDSVEDLVEGAGVNDAVVFEETKSMEEPKETKQEVPKTELESNDEIKLEEEKSKKKPTDKIDDDEGDINLDDITKMFS